MTSLSPPLHPPANRREMLANWLALLTLLALGIVWPSADSAPYSYIRVTCGAHTAVTGETPERTTGGKAGGQ
jgi:hypothetical protein